MKAIKQMISFFSPYYCKKTNILLPLYHFKRGVINKQKNGVVVQLVRMPACHAGGRGFESRPFRKTQR